MSRETPLRPDTKPIGMFDRPMVQSADNDRVYFNPTATGTHPVGWYHTDETDDLVGPYPTDVACIEALNTYIKELQ